MSKRSSAIMWLVMCFLCGATTFLLCGGGGGALWHTHSHVKVLEKRLEEDDITKNPPKVPLTRAQADERDRRMAEGDKEKSNYELYRIVAAASMGVGVLTALMTLAFGVMGMMNWFKKPSKKAAAADDDEAEDADEPDEPDDADSD